MSETKFRDKEVTRKSFLLTLLVYLSAHLMKNRRNQMMCEILFKKWTFIDKDGST